VVRPSGSSTALLESHDVGVVKIHIDEIFDVMAKPAGRGLRNLIVLLERARSELRMETVGPVSLVIGQGGVFDYFDEVRRVVGLAKSDLLFVDPYMDADFVARYLPHVSPGVRVRLLSSKYISALASAADMFAKQHDTKIEVRSAPGLHDRFVIVDGNACYQSGASFKDGARNASTTLTQITDALVPVIRTYEDVWANGMAA
jgi:hypothetical protein